MISRFAMPKIEQYIRSIRNNNKREYARAYLDFVMANPVTWMGMRGPCYECSYMAAQAVRHNIDAIARTTL